MSQSKITQRHNLIINKLRKQQSTFAEISDYLKRESELKDLDLTISDRTFKRDVKEIGEVYGIYIKYDFSARVYFIEEDLSDELQNRRFEALDIFNALKIKERQENQILFDNRQSKGTEQLYDLLHAINNHLQISFSYKRFESDNAVEPTVNPLAIKEFKYRWYLFGQDVSDNNITKRYGLDRMFNLQFSKTTFEPPTDFNLAEDLKYCFGIAYSKAEKPSDIILSFKSVNGKYVKTLPLHHTQKIVLDNDKELRISLKLYLTEDFVMELLSLGNKVKVIEPQELIDEVKSAYQKALKEY